VSDVATYYQRCKALGYGLRTHRYPADRGKSWWSVWFNTLLAGQPLESAGDTREDACWDLWRKALNAGLVKDDAP